MRPEPHQVAGDPLQLRHHDPDRLSAGRDLEPEQLLHREGEREAVAHPRQVIHPVGDGDRLLVHLVLDRLLHPGVEVADVRDRLENRLAVQLSESLNEALHIDSPKLIECNEPRAALEPASRTPRVRAPASCHRCHDDGAEMLVQFVRRHDHAWSRLLDFTTERGIEANQIDLPTTDHLAGYRHFHSSRSNFVDVDSSRSTSSPRARIRFAAAAQPLRGPRAAWTTNRPGWAWSSTSSGRSASSSSVFGIRIPRELPILTMRVLVAIVITV